jgi:hypothetical protein
MENELMEKMRKQVTERSGFEQKRQIMLRGRKNTEKLKRVIWTKKK